MSASYLQLNLTICSYRGMSQLHKLAHLTQVESLGLYNSHNWPVGGLHSHGVGLHSRTPASWADPNSTIAKA